MGLSVYVYAPSSAKGHNHEPKILTSYLVPLELAARTCTKINDPTNQEGQEILRQVREKYINIYIYRNTNKNISITIGDRMQAWKKEVEAFNERLLERVSQNVVSSQTAV
jgi:hypothetical protein